MNDIGYIIGAISSFFLGWFFGRGYLFRQILKQIKRFNLTDPFWLGDRFRVTFYIKESLKRWFYKHKYL